MRKFLDDKGRPWTALVARNNSGDYKGRYHLALEDAASSHDVRVEVVDVRWNSRRTAERTVATMSDLELRRRLRAAVGREPPAPDGAQTVFGPGTAVR